MWSPRSHLPARRAGRPRLTLAGQFLILQLAVVALVLLIVSIISVRQSTSAFADERGTQMRSVSEYLANISVVRSQVQGRDPAARLAPSIDRALKLSGASDISIASPDGTVLSSSNPTLVGRRIDLAESRVRQGRGWTGDVQTPGGRSVAAHAPILADDGTLVGLSVAEQRYPSTWQRLTNAAPDLALFLGVGALLGAAGSWLLARLIKRRTRGLEPREIATLADHREALIHSIREGVIAVDTDDRVTMVNDSARDLLGMVGEVVGRRLCDLALEPQVSALLATADGPEDAVVLVGDRVLVFNQRSASSRGKGIGTVTTMRDRTELVQMQSQLSSNLSITDTLRAQTHEFANQLHTISGLVQLEEYDEVTHLVGRLTRRRAEIVDDVTSRIDDPAVAALVVAKSSVAGEAGVDLVLDPSSDLPALTGSTSADLTTIVGNLIDNAIDACRAEKSPRVVVKVSADTERSDTKRIVLEVSDNGPGIAEDLRQTIFARGFSTKPDVAGGRGIGLALVQLICTQRGGQVTVTHEHGATFRVELPVPRLPDHDQSPTHSAGGSR